LKIAKDKQYSLIKLLSKNNVKINYLPIPEVARLGPLVPFLDYGWFAPFVEFSDSGC